MMLVQSLVPASIIVAAPALLQLCTAQQCTMDSCVLHCTLSGCSCDHPAAQPLRMPTTMCCTDCGCCGCMHRRGALAANAQCTLVHFCVWQGLVYIHTSISVPLCAAVDDPPTWAAREPLVALYLLSLTSKLACGCRCR
ncbi:hypothetical protein COO60DRAFT_339114 [Scenedesmus sp. NREL 46B-D3]|nr:hypothetical protein COO60DRAFT_339114 [Scenedesmus sp. NREL 46B-D3]